MEASGLQRAPEEPVWRPIDATTEERRRRFEAVAAFTEKFGPFSSFLKMKVESLDDGMLFNLKIICFRSFVLFFTYQRSRNREPA